jgi:biotin carboxyl carrier protein
MRRVRVTDHTTGELVLDREILDPDLGSLADGGTFVAGVEAGNGRGQRRCEVVIAGWRFDFDVEDAALAELRERATRGRQQDGEHGPTPVHAIIPGRVVSLAVEIGSVVEPGQRLLAVEAMKMENELRAPRAGVVERLAVIVGQTVELGDVLVVLR